MVRPAPRAEALSIDLIALPLLFCLLAAVVGLFALNEEQAPPDPAPICCAPPVKDPRAAQLRQLIGTAEQVLDEQNVMHRKLDFAVTSHDTAETRTVADALRETIGLAEQIATAEQEAKRLQDQLDALGAVPKPPASSMPRPEDAGFGTYTGPFVLLECENGRAVVYPGGWRITGQPSEADWKRLMDQIRQAGFVAFAVRPSGWYANAFDKLRVRMFRELGTSNSVGRSVFPIKENEPIKPYLPG